jgi:hypothetical protein
VTTPVSVDEALPEVAPVDEGAEIDGPAVAIGALVMLPLTRVLSGPGPEDTAEDEAGSEDIDWDGTCEAVSIERHWVHGAQEHGLTAPALGGCKFPSLSTVHPLGTTEAVAVPVHGQPVLVA